MRQWLKDLRLNEKLTQQEAANAVGISRTMWASIEKGERDPSIKTAIKIAARFQFSYSKFFETYIEKYKSV